jgi:RNA polymerase sigma-70 factor (ECF subfamily)
MALLKSGPFAASLRRGSDAESGLPPAPASRAPAATGQRDPDPFAPATTGTRALAPAATGPWALDPRDDSSLIRAVAEGDRQALAALYERHGQAVFGFILRRLDGDRALAEEVLQDLMLAVWRGAGRFRGDSQLRTWLLAIAHRSALNARRRRRPQTLSLDPSRDQHGVLDDRTQADARGDAERNLAGAELRRALERLPIELRDALDLTLYQGLSCAEAADVLGVAAGTIKSRLFRARARLQEILAEENDHAS